MEQKLFRTVIKHFYFKGITPKEIKSELNKIHRKSAPVIYKIHDMVLSDRRIKLCEIGEATSKSKGTVYFA